MATGTWPALCRVTAGKHEVEQAAEGKQHRVISVTSAPGCGKPGEPPDPGTAISMV